MYTVTIIGRPNVGKSTIFNRLLGERRAIVHPKAGVTRDRKQATLLLTTDHLAADTVDTVDTVESTDTSAATLPEENTRVQSKLAVRLTDTGGLFASEADPFSADINKQVEQALATSDLVLFIVDASAITGADQEIASFLYKSGKPVWLIANKVDRLGDPDLLSEVYSLGFSTVLGISAEHGIRFNPFREELAKHVATTIRDEQKTRENVTVASGRQKGPDNRVNTGETTASRSDKEAETTETPIKLAIIGRPNVGKSSLFNYLLGEERSIVSKVAGTTRDSIESHFTFHGHTFSLVDTAGLRRKRKVHEDIEYYSNLRARNSIESASITILLLEPETLITDQDKKICDLSAKQGKGLIFVVNKWDQVKENTRSALRTLEDTMRFQFPTLASTPIRTISAKSGHGITKLLDLCAEIQENRARQIPTALLNKFVGTVLQSYIPSKRGKHLRVYYAVQTGIFPPRFTFFVNDATIAGSQYRKYLVNKLREHFSFSGTPVFISIRDKKDD